MLTEKDKNSIIEDYGQVLLSNGKEQEKIQLESASQSAYRQAKQAFKTQAFTAQKPVRQFGKPGGGLDYGVGDRVSHMKFGEGTVMNIVEGGRDYEGGYGS